MDEPEDLWGDLGSSEVRTPLSFLKEQASVLGAKTQHVVEGRVNTTSSYQTFTHSLILVVPSLDNYEYELLKIRHGIGLYPVENSHPYKEFPDEESFVDWLRQELSSPRTKKVIGDLMAQANS